MFLLYRFYMPTGNCLVLVDTTMHLSINKMLEFALYKLLLITRQMLTASYDESVSDSYI